MRRSGLRAVGFVALLACAGGLGGCGGKEGYGDLQRPPRPAAMDAYAPFVGSWTWEADMTIRNQDPRRWTGTADWRWTLDDRQLAGRMSASSGDQAFESEGMWGLNPSSGRYVWWMFNNWGYPQHGTARYKAADRCWTMRYKSVGLDGTTSYGRYALRFLDDNTIDWCMTEWLDPFHLIQKVEMKGTYRRK
jgi:hypothetical protein